MPSGGHARSGPAPDPLALRRDRKNDQGTWTDLPATGRTAPAPTWPAPAQTAREAELWTEMWACPQALIWERDGIAHYVAMFVRLLAEAELEKASAENRKTVRMMYADLYLTSDSMARARLRITSGDTASKPTPVVNERPNIKDRFLRSVEHGPDHVHVKDRLPRGSNG